MNNDLPSIAENTFTSRKRLIILILITFMMVSAMYWLSIKHDTTKKDVEIMENYSIEAPLQNVMLPPVVESVPATPPPVENPEPTPEQIALVQEKQKELAQRLASPLMVVNQAPSINLAVSPAHEAANFNDPNLKFMHDVSNQENNEVKATSLGSLNNLIAEGSLIHAILEPAINSELPGMLRAIVSEPVYAEDGSGILIPRGSRLIGQYKSGILQGQARIFVVWKRLITTDGLSVNLGSPGVDDLGVGGMEADEVDRHFWQRFGTASLLSIIGAGTANIGVNNTDNQNAAMMYREAVANSFSQSANAALQQDLMVAPTLRKYQGQPFIVFVAHDLRFEIHNQSIHKNIQIF